MKVLLISDVHSNVVALNVILNFERNVDKILCAGDYVDYGLQPKEVLQVYEKQHFIGVRGNHDNHMINVWDQLSDGVEQSEFKWIHHNAKLLTQSDIDFLKNIPKNTSLDIDGVGYIMQHQWKENSYETIQSEYHFDQFWKENYSGRLSGDFEKRIIFGHTHRQGIHYVAPKKSWINPGSVSYRRPDDPTKVAHYMIIQDGEIIFKQIPYDKADIMLEVNKWIGIIKDSDMADARFFFSEE